MPVLPTYPGVYVEELASGVKTVTGVATSTAAFVGSFNRGLVNRATRLLSLADFERALGGADRASETSYAIAQFFANGGGEAWAVRVVDTVGDGSVDPAHAASVMLKSGNDDVLTLTAGRRERGLTWTNPGEWANNLRAQVDHDVAAADAGLFNLTVNEVVTSGGRPAVARGETFRNLSLDPANVRYAPTVVNAGSQIVYAELVGSPAKGLVPSADAGTVTLDDPGQPAKGGTLTVKVGDRAMDLVFSDPVADLAAFAPVLRQLLRGAAFGLAAGDRPLLAGADVTLSGDDLAISLGAAPLATAPQVLFSGDAAAALKLGDVAIDLYAKFAGGLDGRPPAAGARNRPLPASAFTGDPVAKTGLHALDEVDLFNILCLPEAVYLAGESMAAYTAAIEYARDRRAMAIVDIPEDAAASLDTMTGWMAANDGLRDANAAVYFPRTLVPDPLDEGRLRSIGASGTVAGLWARTDASRGVWKAPAGTDARLQNVGALACNLTDSENGVLNPLGVNCLRAFPVYSAIVWGARTLYGADALASDWKYISVRRLTLFLEESLYRGTKWVVFEPNDEPLWAQIRLSLGAFMHDLFRQGAFQGASPRDAYFVKCDGETTTPTDIDAGIVNVEIGFAPLKPAEFVVLKFHQIAGAIAA